MSERYKADAGIKWQCADVRSLPFPDSTIDVAFDKGTLDAMIFGSPWDPPDLVRENTGRYVHEVSLHALWLDLDTKRRSRLREFSRRTAYFSTSRFDSHILSSLCLTERAYGMFKLRLCRLERDLLNTMVSCFGKGPK
jgi:hypothetical protein